MHPVAAIRRATLANGLSVIELPMAERLATTIAIVFPAGARQEADGERGLAHLLEHLAFRGTTGYPSATTLNRTAEHLGTELDGVTTNDYVEFSSVVRAEFAMATTDLLTEIAGRPMLSGEHVDAERSVIVQEIADDQEDPGARADALLSEALFAGHRLGTDIAGTADDVRHLSHEQIIGFRERAWSPAGGLAVLAGNLDHIDRTLLEELLLRIPARDAPPGPPPIPPFEPRMRCEQADGDQVHLRLAYDLPGLDLCRARDRAVAGVFSNVLGGPMGSRLYDELRQQRALCYWIDGYVWGYEHASFLSVDCSVRAADVEQVRERIESILADLRANGPTHEEASRACRYSAGTCALGFESTRARADHAIELIMEYDDHDVDPRLHLQATESVTRDELRELAAAVRPGPCVGSVGPIDDDQLVA